MLEERVITDDQITVDRDGSISVREATVIVRDGNIDEAYPPRYHRRVLHPGDDLGGKPARVIAIAQGVWTDDVVAAFAARRAAQVAAERETP